MIARTAQNAAGETVELQADPAAPLVAQVFKTRIDPFVQKINFIRVYSGTMKKDETVPATGMRKGLKLGQLFELQANETQPVDDAGPGNIVAVIKMEDLRTGMTLGELALPPIPFPSPMVGLAVTPKSRGDETKLSGSLNKICQEDSTFRIDRDAQTKEMVATGMSELHLQIIRERLKRRDKVEVDTREPKIPYRETIQINAEGSYRHKKQTGGRGQFGEVHIRMFPLPKDVNIEEWAVKARFPSLKDYHYDAENNFVWIDSVVGGTIPSNFLPAVEKGFKDRLERGVIAGYKVQNVCVEVHFGKHHPGGQLGTGLQDGRLDGLPQRLPAGQAGAVGADREDRDHRAQQQGGRHQQRHVGPPRPRAGHRLRRRRPANGHRRGPLGRSDDLRPQPLQHDRRPGELRHRVQPLRRGAGQHPAGDHRQGAGEGRGGRLRGKAEGGRGKESPPDCVRGAAGLRPTKHPDHVPGQTLFDLAVPRDRLQNSRIRVAIPVVFPAMTNQTAAQVLDRLDEVDPFHEMVNSSTLRMPGI